MARTTSKNAIKTIDAKLKSKKMPKRKNNLKDIKKSTTLKDKTVESIIDDLDNITTSVSTKTDKPITRSSSTTKKDTSVGVSTTKPKKTQTSTSKSTTKSTSTKKSTTAKSTTKKSTKVSSDKKNASTTKKTSSTRSRKKTTIEPKFDVVDDIISDLDNTDKFKYDDNDINNIEKEVIANEFDEDILSDKKFDVIDEKIDSSTPNNNEIEEFTIEDKTSDDSSNSFHDTTSLKRRSRKNDSNKLEMIENNLDDNITDNVSKKKDLDNIDKESSDDVVSSFEEDLGVKNNLIDDKYDNLEGDLRSLYDVGDDVVENIHKNKKDYKQKFSREKKVKIKKRKDIKVKDLDREDYSSIKPSLLDYISQRVLNFLLAFFFIVFLLMCIAFLIFVIFVSTF